MPFSTVIPSAVLCVVIVVSTVVLATEIVQHGEVDNLTNSGKNLSWSNVIIAVQNLQCARKKVSGTKMINFDNCERSEEMREK